MKRFFLILFFAITALVSYAAPPRLAVEQLFDGRYTKEKGVTISISKDNGIYYRGFSLKDNPAILRKMIEAIEKDAPRATKYFEQEGEGGHYTSLKLVNNGEKIDIGLQRYKGSAYLFIKGNETAFK